MERREGDSNSRVQGTVDFESTAIPGYAISAYTQRLKRGSHKSDAIGRYMLVSVLNGGEITSLEFSEATSVSEVLQKMEITPSTVLVIHQDSVIPHNAQITDDIELELIIVSSGG